MALSERKRIVAAVVVAAILLLLGLVYLFVDPGSSHLAPKCIIKILTGYDCPSCGGQRALHALLNGRMGEAIMFNPFLVLAVPYVLLLAYSLLSRSGFATRVGRVVRHPIAIWGYVALYFLWWVVRNTHWWLSQTL
jgi:hypothetical protein